MDVDKKNVDKQARQAHGEHYAALWTEAYDEWCKERSPAKTRNLAAIAIQGGLPYYDTSATGTSDLGANGWRDWLKKQQRTSEHGAKVSDKQPAAYVPNPAPWER